MSTEPAQTLRSSGVTEALKEMNLKLEETFGNVFSDEECDIDVAKLALHQTLIAAPRLHVQLPKIDMLKAEIEPQFRR